MAKNICPVFAVPIPKQIYAKSCWIESSILLAGLMPRNAFPHFFFWDLLFFWSMSKYFNIIFPSWSAHTSILAFSDRNFLGLKKQKQNKMKKKVTELYFVALFQNNISHMTLELSPSPCSSCPLASLFIKSWM